MSSKVSRTASRTATGGLQDLGKLRIAGVASISLVGLIHLFVTPEYYGFAAYLGLLMIANFAGSIVSAMGIYQGRVWGLVAWSSDGRWRFPGVRREQDFRAARTALLGALYGATGPSLPPCGSNLFGTGRVRAPLEEEGYRFLQRSYVIRATARCP